MATAAIAHSSSWGLVCIGVVGADSLPAESSGAGGVLQGCLLIMSRPDRSVLEGSATIPLGSCRVSGLFLLPLLPCQGRSKEEGRVERGWERISCSGEVEGKGDAPCRVTRWVLLEERSVRPAWSKEGREHQHEHPRCQPSSHASCSSQEGTRLALQRWGQDRAAKL